MHMLNMFDQKLDMRSTGAPLYDAMCSDFDVLHVVFDVCQ
jgi:hypothetical protein